MQYLLNARERIAICWKMHIFICRAHTQNIFQHREHTVCVIVQLALSALAKPSQLSCVSTLVQASLGSTLTLTVAYAVVMHIR